MEDEGAERETMTFSVGTSDRAVRDESERPCWAKGAWCIWGWRVWRYYGHTQPTGKG